MRQYELTNLVIMVKRTASNNVADVSSIMGAELRTQHSEVNAGRVITDFVGSVMKGPESSQSLSRPDPMTNLTTSKQSLLVVRPHNTSNATTAGAQEGRQGKKRVFDNEDDDGEDEEDLSEVTSNDVSLLNANSSVQPLFLGHIEGLKEKEKLSKGKDKQKHMHGGSTALSFAPSKKVKAPPGIALTTVEILT
jgi:hypothetical protein